MGELMQRSLAGAAVDAPSDFVLTITPDTVERALAVRLAGLQDWIGRNPDFARLFDATWSAVQRNGEANGEIDIEASELIVDGVRHPIVADKSGVVETVVRNRDHMIISGWAADTVNRIPTANVVATVGNKVVAKWFPGTPRIDNEAIYGRNIRPSNFVMRVNGAPPAPEIIRVFALMEDGRAVQLSSTNPLVAGPALLAAARQ